VDMEGSCEQDIVLSRQSRTGDDGCVVLSLLKARKYIIKY
jgi:hypothetical protein